MDRGWYVRLSIMVAVAIGAWFALWPSLDEVIPAPAWVEKMFPHRIAKGLDIQGGLRLVYEVDVDEAIRDRRDRLAELLFERMGVALGIVDEDEIDDITREQKDRITAKVRVERDRDNERRIIATFTDTADSEKLSHDFLQDTFPELREIERGGNRVIVAIREESQDRIRTDAVEQAVKTIGNRIDELQLREATVYGHDTDLVVEVPGANEETFTQIRSIIGRTARLEFKVVDDEGSNRFFSGVEVPEGDEIEHASETVSGGENRPNVTGGYLTARGEGSRQRLLDYISTLTVPDDHQVAIGRLETNDEMAGPNAIPEEAWRTYFLFRTAEVTGEDIEDAFVSYDQSSGGNGKPVVSIQFKPTGAASFERLTGRNVKRRMAIVLDNRVESAPVINERIGGGRCQITLGSYMRQDMILKEANELVLVLRAGALPAPIRPANEQLIGPSLGADAVTKGIQASIVCLLITLVFMLVYYEVAGLMADIMVMLNVVLLLALLAVFEATLTLPGIAGMALAVAMSVDCNVLVNERIREELRLGKSPRSAVEQGFSQSFWAIFDGHVTTLISGIVLFQYGTGPIKGFAVTMMMGIVTALFTGVFCSRIGMEWLVRGLKVQRLRVG